MKSAHSEPVLGGAVVVNTPRSFRLMLQRHRISAVMVVALVLVVGGFCWWHISREVPAETAAQQRSVESAIASNETVLSQGNSSGTAKNDSTANTYGNLAVLYAREGECSQAHAALAKAAQFAEPDLSYGIQSVGQMIKGYCP